jgi:hypothetical protein
MPTWRRAIAPHADFEPISSRAGVGHASDGHGGPWRQQGDGVRVAVGASRSAVEALEGARHRGVRKVRRVRDIQLGMRNSYRHEVRNTSSEAGSARFVGAAVAAAGPVGDSQVAPTAQVGRVPPCLDFPGDNGYVVH